MKRYFKQKGFTLIELLVVIAIIGLLSTLAIVAMGNARQKSRDSKRVSDIKQIQTALELYFNDRDGYPDGTNLVLGSDATCLDTDGFNTTCTGATKYMASVPAYPAPADGANCSDAAYTYNSASPYDTYNIQYCLGAETGGIPGDTVHKATPAGIVND